MSEIICGELFYKRKKYHFTFQDNILNMLPSKLEPFYSMLFDYDEKETPNCNINGITEKKYNICFIDVKPRPVGSGVLRCFVPAYTLNKSNGLIPPPKADKIENIIFKGHAIDNFYPPKRIITNEPKGKNISININLDKFKAEKYDFKDEIIQIFSGYNMPNSNNSNEVLNVSSYFEISFKKPKSITSILKTYLKVQKLFGFLNNRQIVTWDSITLQKKIYIEEIQQNITIEFNLYVAYDPSKSIDIGSFSDSITLEDIKDYFPVLYTTLTRKDYNIYYLPLNKNDNSIVTNDYFLKIAYTFESQMLKCYPKFKSDINQNFKYSKSLLLRNITKELSRLSKIAGTGKKRKYLEDFYGKIKNIEGTLEEKLLFCLRKFDSVILARKNLMQSHYGLQDIPYQTISKSFSVRRNKIAHGIYVGNFEDIDIISYTLVKMCIYCLILEHCNIPIEEITKICNKLF